MSNHDLIYVEDDEDDREDTEEDCESDVAGEFLDSDEEDDTPGCSKASKKRNFQILNKEQVIGEMNKIAEDVAGVIGYPKSVCRTMLHRFKWNKEELLEKFCEEPSLNEFCGTPDVEPQSKKIKPERSYGYCIICDETKPLISLTCNHLFCFECWNSYLSTKVTGEGVSYITCPSTKCRTIIEDEMALSLIIDPDVKDSYKLLVINAFVKSSRMLKWCPGKGCTKVAKVNAIGSKSGTSLSTAFCSRNGSNNALMTVRRTTGLTHIPKTPKCKTAIEKNGGCNHMTCKSQTCKHEFCWICLDDWSKHNASYSCNRYNEEAKKKETTAQNSRAALQRYLHYYNRFKNHQNSLLLETKLYDEVEVKMKQMQDFTFSYVETQFLKQAVEVLHECRRTLMYTYAFAST
uniref:RBR-type E3 ubiquitin transferase n=1 Tax=Ditylenchus dipsaci TaxID=166011 RepID=A0A915ER00_9BILA